MVVGSAQGTTDAMTCQLIEVMRHTGTALRQAQGLLVCRIWDVTDTGGGRGVVSETSEPDDVHGERIRPRWHFRQTFANETLRRGASWRGLDRVG
jgi:hypothetical protein